MDKTSPEYWDEFWKTNRIPKEIQIQKFDINTYLYREFDAFFRKFIEPNSDLSLIELGCGNSVWLPYFKKEFLFRISGLDYSRLGCERSRMILDYYNVEGAIFEGNLLTPPTHLISNFDIVVSFGVIEHFQDIVEVLKAHALFLKKNGKIFVSVPNMHGFPGWYQKIMNKEVFDAHVPIDKDKLMEALSKAGFKNTKAEYLLPVAVSAQIEGSKPDKFIQVKKALTLNLSRLSKIFWAMEIFSGVRLPRTKLFSPALIAYGEK
ncbi:class I SAM-dependent methyltransferase [Schleiferia thermophila]|jgi:SAM-dependent methyltransferase|uniref:Methyltransferase family protein n=1 Tax=Schleiferia thermophila TaxID=884107 RepID=A0A369A3C2_9FLAO|nr:class I SAM-dependent methyltransferase [Schleiferia thermophila]KFD39793.1 hypothetical protein AT05_02980 [Schleiferia thermophila str. Yellowstone]RCX03812.1 methyltransferase family protein [Schleiferia thermophila]GCD80044.1 hypothetical protein JCM30197_12910 [Schleiferia thermophila]